MSKINRFDGNYKAFASEQLTNERTTFGTEVISDDLTAQQTPEYLRGMGIVGPSQFPTLQDFNAVNYAATQSIAYLHQMGVPEWNAGQEYQIGSAINRDGALYFCKTSDHVSATPPESDTVNWIKDSKDKVIHVNNIAGLQDLDLTNIESVFVGAYHDITDTSGGGLFVKATGRHNGGTFIDPAREFPADWNNQTQLTAWFADSGVDVVGLKRVYDGAVNANFFGSYAYLDTNPIDSSYSIQQCYDYCCDSGEDMSLIGKFLIKKGLKFSKRSVRVPVIFSAAELFVDITDAPFDLTLDTLPSKAGVYIGDDSSNGIYKLDINGYLDVINIGTQRQLECHGVVLQSSAYGYYNIRNVSGFDTNLYLKGVILAILDGKRGEIEYGNLDVRIMANQGVQGGLRHTNNQTALRDYTLRSTYKIKASYPENQTGIFTPNVGRNITFSNIDLESNNYSELTTHRSDAAVVLNGMGEVIPKNMSRVVLQTCWFEKTYQGIPFIKTDSNLTLKEVFFAHKSDDYLIELTGAESSVTFEDCGMYFGDSEPNYVVKCANKLQVVMRRTGAYGINDGTSVNVFDPVSIPTGSVMDSFSLDDNDKLFTFSGLSTYAGAVANYMQNGEVDLSQVVTDFIGISNYTDVPIKVSFSGGDGGSSGYAEFEIISPRGVGLKVYPKSASQDGVTLVGNIVTFPTTLTGSWFGARMTIQIITRNRVGNGFLA